MFSRYLLDFEVSSDFRQIARRLHLVHGRAAYCAQRRHPHSSGAFHHDIGDAEKRRSRDMAFETEELRYSTFLSAGGLPGYQEAGQVIAAYEKWPLLPINRQPLAEPSQDGVLVKVK